jgi:hypothetical protein
MPRLKLTTEQKEKLAADRKLYGQYVGRLVANEGREQETLSLIYGMYKEKDNSLHYRYYMVNKDMHNHAPCIWFVTREKGNVKIL